MWNFSYTCLASLWLHRFYIYSVIAFGISLWIAVQLFTTKKKGEKSNGNLSSEVVEEKQANGYAALQAKEVYVAGVKIFYGSQTGTARRFAKGLAEEVISLNLPVEVISMGDYDPDDCLAEEVCNKYKLFLLLSRIFSFCISLLLFWKSPKLCVCKLLLKHR
ncbi:tRNA wybutosine-synthesizing protein 1-like protein [Anas platyrhynchos]|uniref:tRNA wybutosine-synthesizing protein 1-like protein n=1 Tax=Anas platyrhynchos TaxID=8839 RepID=R0JCX5_ANAPL|nr:tRNA wybutosine-synthesizing protein 1-like protein [Anas platyrhynchos]